MPRVYVRLLDEGTEVFRPTEATALPQGGYRLLPTRSYDPQDEKWEFPPGSIVDCRLTYIDGRNVLLAVERNDAM